MSTSRSGPSQIKDMQQCSDLRWSDKTDSQSRHGAYETVNTKEKVF